MSGFFGLWPRYVVAHDVPPSDLALLRADYHRARFYLSISQPRSLLAAQVNGSFSKGARAIAYDNGLGSGFASIEDGHLLRVVTSLNTETVRVRSITGSQSSGTVTVAANSIAWENDANFEVLEDYPLRPRQPRFTTSTFYKDWLDTYTDETLEPPPVVIGGPHRAGFLESGSLVFNIDLSDSYAVAAGASISSYAASVVPSSGVTVNVNAGTGIGTITFTVAGQYWVKFTVTDSNGKSQSSRRRFFVHDSDPTSSDYPFTDFSVQGLTGDWGRGGWALRMKIHGVADTDVVPDEALACLWYVPTYGTTQQYIGGPDGAEQMLFCGYIRRGSVVHNWNDGSIDFEAETVQALLRNISMQAIPLQAVRDPTKWYEYPTWLTNGRAVHHYWRFHSTLFECCDVYGLSDDSTIYRAGVTFQKGDMYSQAEAIIREAGICAHAVCNKVGQLRIVRDIQLLDSAARGSKSILAEITKEDRHADITIIDRWPFQAAMAYVDGIYFDGATAEAICARAAGDVPEDHGSRNPVEKRNQTLTGETHAKSLVGRLLCVDNNPYPEVRVDFDGIWIGLLDVDGREWWQVSLDATDTNRGIVWSGQKLVCRQVNCRIDPVNGYIAASTILETEATGPDGEIVPCIGLPDPPETKRPIWDDYPTLEALIALSSASYRDDLASDWTELQTADYTGGIIDPWWRIKSGSNNPLDVIWWAVADGAVYRVVKSDGLPDNRTPVTNPPNTWSDSPAPSISDLEFIGPFPDHWVESIWYVLARYQDGGGNWRGWLAYSDDDGLSWTWVELYDGVSLPTAVKPLWLAVNGTSILVTIWEDDASDTLRLLWFDSSLTYDDEVSLGAATEAELDAETYFAFPVTVLDDDDLWHVAGRMDAPAGLAGTQHIIKTANAGTSWSSVENGLSDKVVKSLFISLLDGSDRSYWATVKPSDEPGDPVLITDGAEPTPSYGPGSTDWVVLVRQSNTTAYMYVEDAATSVSYDIGRWLVTVNSGISFGSKLDQCHPAWTASNWTYAKKDLQGILWAYENYLGYLDGLISINPSTGSTHEVVGYFYDGDDTTDEYIGTKGANKENNSPTTWYNAPTMLADTDKGLTVGHDSAKVLQNVGGTSEIVATDNTIFTSGDEHYDLAHSANNKSLTIYKNGSTWYVARVTVSGTTATKTWSATWGASPGISSLWRWRAIWALDEDKYLIFYNATSGGHYVVVATDNGSGLTYGTPLQLSSAVPNYYSFHDFCPLTATKVAVAYHDDDGVTTYRLRVATLTVSGNNLSWDSNELNIDTYTSGYSYWCTSLVKLTSFKAAMSWRDPSSGNLKVSEIDFTG